MSPFKILLLVTLLACGGSAESRKKVVDMMRVFLKRIETPSGYNKDIMPLNPSGGAVPVGISTYIRNVELEDKKMQLKVDLTFRMFWRDNRLAFSDSPDVDFLRFSDYSKLWLPDPFFANAESTEINQSIHPEAFVRVNSTGDVMFSTRMRLKVHCPLDLHRFPHDVQMCAIKMGSYGYTTSDITFNMLEKVSVSEDVAASNRFVLMEVNHEGCTPSNTTTGTYSCMWIKVKLQRVSSSYILEWYLPCACLVIISFFSHLVATDNLLVRVILTLGPLLTLSASSIIYGQNLLRFAYSTAMDVYTGISILVIFLTLLHVVVVYYYSSSKQYDMNQPSTHSDIQGEEPSKGQTKMDKFKSLMKRRGDLISRVAIIGFYVIFICLYLIAYSS